MKKPKKIKLSTLQAKADDVASIYVRKKFSVNGYCTCVSCGRSFAWNNLDCGHFVPKARGAAVRWVEENMAPECRDCNRFNEAHLIGYTLWMQDYYGQSTIDWLRAEAKKTLSPSQKRALAEDAIERYSREILEGGRHERRKNESSN